MRLKTVLIAAGVACVLGGTFGACGIAAAQDGAVIHPRRPGTVIAGPAHERNLTINRRPDGLDPDDIYQDGPIRYNSVRTYDPAPYADSGRQFPFGLDGIGGYGSDIGFLAGHDSVIYDRGP